MKQMFSVFLALFVFLSYGLTTTKKFVQVFLPGGKIVTAELAVSDSERAMGLMFRETVNSDQGMLFIFEEEGKHSFWMKNMVVSIDILWLNSAKQIVHIEERVPPCKRDPCPSYTPGVPAMYVLELKAGSVAECGIKLSDKMNFVLE
ncbi:MAG: DUF192 domain-containing protein [Candidatus Aminicenantes bacterium]|nr:DUF192 domain-containing protein [Candidatus Aminicenantes bacterium]